MQVCTSLQTDNHASTPPLCFLQAGCPSCRPTNSVKALKAHLHLQSSTITNTKPNSSLWPVKKYVNLWRSQTTSYVSNGDFQQPGILQSFTVKRQVLMWEHCMSSDLKARQSQMTILQVTMWVWTLYNIMTNNHTNGANNKSTSNICSAKTSELTKPL